MRVMCDGVEAMVLPECAYCTLAGKHPHAFDECPGRWLSVVDECDPDCIYYTERWDEERA